MLQHTEPPTGAASQPKSTADRSEPAPSSPQLILYMRLGCHLCDGVRHLLLQENIPHQLLNIDSDAELKRQYDWLVPVLYCRTTDRELVYPFGRDELRQFIQRHE